MSNEHGSSNVNNQSSGVERERKRKWTTQMMKTWVATDPSRTAPEIHHRDPKAAARAEKKKRRKIEMQDTAPTSPSYRTDQRPPPILDAFHSNLPHESTKIWSNTFLPAYASTGDGHAMLPPPEAYGVVDYGGYGGPSSTPGANRHIFDTLIPFEEEKRTTWEWDTQGREHDLESARWSSPEGSTTDEYQGPTVEYQATGTEAREADGSLDTVEHDEARSRMMSVHKEEGKLGGEEIEEATDQMRYYTEALPDAAGDIQPDIRAEDSTPGGAKHDASGENREDGQKDDAAAPGVLSSATEGAPSSRTTKKSGGAESGRRTPAINDSGLELNEGQELTDTPGGASSRDEEEKGDESETHSGETPNGSTQSKTGGGQLECEDAGVDIGEDANNKTATQEFNTGWRRYGPQGEDICNYVPHFSDAPKIRWPTGVRTLAPYIPTGDQRRGMKNKLKWDQIYTTTVARKFKSSRDRPDICVHATFTTEGEAVKLIRQCMAKGLPLVFDEYPDSLRWAHSSSTVDDDPFMSPMPWSDDEVQGVIGANLFSPRDFQDAAVREKEELAPYITATLLDFHTWLKLPGVVRCILDLTCGFPQSDDMTNRIADNVVQTVSQTYGNKYSGHSTVAADMMKTQDWFLLHTSGFLTFGHIDASGMATSAQIRGAGMKEWVIYKATKMPAPKPTDTRRAREKAMDSLVTRMYELIEAASDERLEPKKRKSKDWEVDGCVIELRPGMKYFQPSGTVHAAYTPVPTAAVGKHFFTYDDLHRVEVSRRIQVKYPGTTNHNHTCGVQLMLISMAASIPIKAKGGRVFFRKPSIAMALMLTRPYDYIRDPRVDEDGEIAPVDERDGELQMTERLRSATWATNGTPFERLAHTVAMRILNACKVKYPGDRKRQQPGREYIFEGESWEDPGPTIDMRKVTYDLTENYVDDLDKGNGDDDSSDSELTDLEDL